jgi:uncharacterized protein (DUF983 family)
MKESPVSESTPVRWQPDRTAKLPPWPMPRMADALRRGFRGRCPACGKTRLFRGYLRVADTCGACSAPLGLARADDAPPYFTIVAVGHVVVPGMLMLERAYAPPLWVHTAIWVPLTIAMALALIRPIKGMTVGAMTSLGMLTQEGPG